MKFESVIKQASSSQCQLTFVKVPDGFEFLEVDNAVKGLLFTDYWSSKELPKGEYKFIGYSHQLTEDQINELFASRNEFYQMCNYHEILYNYSAYTGKWAVLKTTGEELTIK